MTALLLQAGEASTDFFLDVLNMSISALWLVMAVIGLRLVLKKAPKWIHVLLWALVAVRLVCPFSIESALSLIPSTQTVSPEIMLSPTPTINTGIAPVNDAVNPIITEAFRPDPATSANPLQILIPVCAALWLLGMAVMLLYTAVSYWLLRRKVASAVRLKKNVYQSEAVASPFVLGLLRPRIYLPFAMEDADIPHVIAHEQAHIRRKDHWWKPLGFLILTVHWFNPALWLSYILLCRDIELACDEKVIKEMDNVQQADYSQALLNCSVHRRSIASCPLAFGEVGVKQRVRNILNYKKPAFWITLVAVVLCIAAGVCFLTNPVQASAPFGQDLYIDRFVYLGVSQEDPDLDVDWNYYITTESYNTLLYAHYQLEEDGTFRVCEAPESGKWATIGIFEEAKLSMLNFDDYFKGDSQWYTELYRPEKFRETYVSAWRVDVNPEGYPGLFYFLLEMEDGDFYLMCGFDQNQSTPAQDEKSAMHWVAKLTSADPATATAVRWFDYLETGDYPDSSADMQAQLPQFPDVTFRATPNELIAETENGSTTLITGMPLWNVFLSDLTGDGISEFCATVSYGSGIIDQHVVVYDFAEGTEYTLWDRGVFDYTLRLKDGILVCERTFYPDDELSASGELMLVSAGGGDGRRLEIITEEEKDSNSVSFENVDFSSVDAIKLSNAHNGKSTAISDPDEIKAICAWLSTISGSNGQNSKGRHYQGTFALTLMAGDDKVFQITFGDEDVFFYGKYDETYAMMYDLNGRDIGSVIRFLYPYDKTGFDWGYEETVVTVEVSPYYTTSAIPEDGLRGEIEYLNPSEITGYGFLTEELHDLALLLRALTEDDFVEPEDFSPTMKINLRWGVGNLTLYSDGNQTAFGDDAYWAVVSGELNKFLTRFTLDSMTSEETASLEELNPYYNSEQAEIDGCVVMRDHDIYANASVFTDFAREVGQGNPATVRIAEFYSEERFAVQVSDIIYDGESFTWRAIADGQLTERNYQYLLCYSGEPTQANASYDSYEAFVLTDAKNVTWNQLWNSLASSQADAAIDFTLVYMDYIYAPNHPTIPDCTKATLELNGEILLTVTDTDALEAMFSQAEETYEPKTWSPGPILRFTGKDGTEVVVTLSLDTDWVCIDGIYYDFGPGYDDDGSLNALSYLWQLLGIDNWPKEVLDAYSDFFLMTN